MKKCAFIFLLLCSNYILTAQTLFTIGNTNISQAEFLRAYNKNKPSTTNKEKQMREYLNLYVNFKLKVKAAQELRLDTLPQINYDVQNFATQVIENYMTDEFALQALINEAAARASKDIAVQYFFVPIAANATAADTLQAYKAITALHSILKSNTSNFIDIAKDVTNKYSLTKFADAGFVTVFTLPYVMENEVYNTTIGKASTPLKTSKGWFIFLPKATRAAMGKWKVAQLLFAYPPNADADKKEEVKAKAYLVYAQLKKDLPFDQAAAKYSDDRTSANNEGVLQEFGTGTYSPDFEKNILTLINEGEVTLPFETTFGYHIVKKISQKKIPIDIADNALLYDIKQAVMQNERIEIVRNIFLKTITQKTNFKLATNLTNAEYFLIADSIIKSKDSDKNKICAAFAKKNIAQFGTVNIVKGSQWVSYVKNNTAMEGISGEGFEPFLNTFKQQLITNYYKTNIEKYNNDYKSQMQEFKEGNMLFEIMEQKVWSVAGQDTIGLKKYYEANKQNYKWATSADVIIFHANTAAIANQAVKDIKNGTNWNVIVKQSDNQIQADSGRYELTQIPGITENTVVNVGNVSNVTTNTTEGDANFVYFIKTYEPNTQRNFTDAKGLVINDYQTLIEKKWIAELTKKYPVKINEALFNQLVK